MAKFVNEVAENFDVLHPDLVKNAGVQVGASMTIDGTDEVSMVPVGYNSFRIHFGGRLVCGRFNIYLGFHRTFPLRADLGMLFTLMRSIMSLSSILPRLVDVNARLTPCTLKMRIQQWWVTLDSSIMILMPKKLKFFLSRSCQKMQRTTLTTLVMKAVHHWRMKLKGTSSLARAKSAVIVSRVAIVSVHVVASVNARKRAMECVLTFASATRRSVARALLRQVTTLTKKMTKMTKTQTFKHQ